MKKLLLFFIMTLVFVTSQAQWVNDPATNTFIANTSADAGEIFLATNMNTGDTYIQWCSFVGGNGWSPTLQRLNSDGVPQWGPDGIHIAAHQFSTHSEGVAMTTTTDGGVVSCFAVYDGYSCAVKINADGTFPWGEQGIQLFGGLGFSRTEVIATSDGGIWALGFDYSNLYLQYLNNTAGPVITIADNGGRDCMYGQLTLSNDNRVFVTYEKCGNGFYTDKEIYVAGYEPDGTQFSPETLLMSSQTFQVTYSHSAISDGMGGGYVYIWHPAMNNFNTYVFHYNKDGVSTILDTNGVPVHSPDDNNLYINASATVDPVSHDIILFYEQTDDATQYQCKLYLNRITPEGERLWGDGILVLDNGTVPCGGFNIDAFEDEDGFAITYFKGIGQTSGSMATVEAQGFDMKGDPLWSTQLCSNTYNKTGCENSTGFHHGQNIIAWVNATDAVTGGGVGGLYGQNILPNGMMGPIPTGCPGPTGFQGEYVYDEETMEFGALLSWDQPGNPVETYRLTRTSNTTGEETVIEFNSQDPSYFDQSGIGHFRYQLQALYADIDCGFSEPATTPTGQNFVTVEVTSVAEDSDEPIVTILGIYTLAGQRLQGMRLETLSKGVYVLEGLTADGKHVRRKIAVTL